jgi:hypothetical protein
MKVENMIRGHAISPICFAFGSFDLKYLIRVHFVIRIKQIMGRTILNTYIHVWGLYAKHGDVAAHSMARVYL